MSAIEPDAAELARAYADMCDRDTPPLEVLKKHWVFYSCVRNRALVNTHRQAAAPAPQALPAPPAPKPAALLRRRDDRELAPPAFSGRAAASGEYIHQGEE